MLLNLIEKFQTHSTYCLSRIGGSDTILLEYYCKLMNLFYNDINRVKEVFGTLLTNNNSNFCNITSKQFHEMVDIVKKYNGYYTLNYTLTKNIDDLVEYCEMIRQSLLDVDESIYLYPMDVIDTNYQNISNCTIPYHNKQLFDRKFSNILINIRKSPKDFTLSYGILESIDIFLPVLNEIIKDKRLLIISPFSASIMEQTKNPNTWFTGDRHIERHIGGYRAPLLTYTTPITYETQYSKIQYPDSSWGETVRRMQKEIEQIEFDIALLACGSYANPLLNQIKKMGRQGIYMGGILQIYFGVMGNRWLQNNPIAEHVRKSLVVSNMIRPIETPQFVTGEYISKAHENSIVRCDAPEGYKAYF